MKILVVRFSSIGDIVLTSSVIRCIKNQLPHATIHFLTKDKFHELVEFNPYISRIICLGNNWNETIDELKQENYDYIIDLHNNLRTHRLLLALKRTSFSFPKRNLKKYLLTNFKWNLLDKNEHVVHRYFSAVKKLGVVTDNGPNDFFTDPKKELELTQYNLLPKKFVAVAIGAQFKTKRLPIDKLVEIINKIDLTIVLLGNKDESKDAETIILKANQKNIISLCGKLSLLDSASIIKNSGVLLTHDTGLMHIAACFDTPIVAVWGNTTPVLGMYAYTPTNLNQVINFEVDSLSCRPCSKIGFNVCPKKHFDCMQKQNSDDIVQAILNAIPKL